MGVYKDILKKEKSLYDILMKKKWKNDLYNFLDFLQFSTTMGYGSKKDIEKVIKDQKLKKGLKKQDSSLIKIFIDAYDDVKEIMKINITNDELFKEWKKVWVSKNIKEYELQYKKKSDYVKIKIKVKKDIEIKDIKVRFLSITPFYIASNKRLLELSKIDVTEYTNENEDIKDITNISKIKKLEKNLIEIEVHRNFIYASSVLFVKINDNVDFQIIQNFQFYMKKLVRFISYIKNGR